MATTTTVSFANAIVWPTNSTTKANVKNDHNWERRIRKIENRRGIKDEWPLLPSRRFAPFPDVSVLSIFFFSFRHYRENTASESELWASHCCRTSCAYAKKEKLEAARDNARWTKSPLFVAFSRLNSKHLHRRKEIITVVVCFSAGAVASATPCAGCKGIWRKGAIWAEERVG